MDTRLILSNPEILGGTPVFAGTRVPVKNLTDNLEGGDTLDKNSWRYHGTCWSTSGPGPGDCG